MWRKVSALSHQLLVRPRELLDITALLVTRPAIAAKLLIASESADLPLAGRYFSTAFSTSVILNAIAFRVLDIETVEELPFWVMHASFVFFAALLASIVASSFRSAPFIV